MTVYVGRADITNTQFQRMRDSQHDEKKAKFNMSNSLFAHMAVETLHTLRNAEVWSRTKKILGGEYVPKATDLCRKG